MLPFFAGITRRLENLGNDLGTFFKGNIAHIECKEKDHKSTEGKEDLRKKGGFNEYPADLAAQKGWKGRATDGQRRNSRLFRIIFHRSAYAHSLI